MKRWEVICRKTVIIDADDESSAIEIASVEAVEAASVDDWDDIEANEIVEDDDERG